MMRRHRAHHERRRRSSNSFQRKSAPRFASAAADRRPFTAVATAEACPASANCSFESNSKPWHVAADAGECLLRRARAAVHAVMAALQQPSARGGCAARSPAAFCLPRLAPFSQSTYSSVPSIIICRSGIASATTVHDGRSSFPDVERMQPAGCIILQVNRQLIMKIDEVKDSRT